MLSDSQPQTIYSSTNTNPHRTILSSRHRSEWVWSNLFPITFPLATVFFRQDPIYRSSVVLEITTITIHRIEIPYPATTARQLNPCQWEISQLAGNPMKSQLSQNILLSEKSCHKNLPEMRQNWSRRRAAVAGTFRIHFRFRFSAVVASVVGCAWLLQFSVFAPRVSRWEWKHFSSNKRDASGNAAGGRHFHFALNYDNRTVYSSRFPWKRWCHSNVFIPYVFINVPDKFHALFFPLVKETMFQVSVVGSNWRHRCKNKINI